MVPAGSPRALRRPDRAGVVIASDGAYSFTVDLQRLWLDKHRRLEWVKEDLADQLARWNSAESLDDILETEKLQTAGEPGQRSSPLVARIADGTRLLDSKQVYRIGRDNRADIPLTDARVSWAHAALRAEGATWVIEDLGSRNGTFLHGKRITKAAVSGPCVVRLGHPEDGPALQFELGTPDSTRDLSQPVAEDPVLHRPGVIRNPVARVPLESRVVSIGRGTGNDVVVADLTVSQQHAELRRSAADRYSVIDLNSHGGTFVNGTRVNQQELQENDLVAIGHATFRLAGGALHRVRRRGPRLFGGAQPAGHGRPRRRAACSAQRHHLPACRTVHAGSRRPRPAQARPCCSTRSQADTLQPAAASDTTSATCTTATKSSGSASGWCPASLSPTTGSLREPRSAMPPGCASPPMPATQSVNGVSSQVLDELGMTPHADTLLERQSAYKRKLVGIGLELLTSPSMLFLDEPTSDPGPASQAGTFRGTAQAGNPAALTGQSIIVVTRDVESKLIDKCDRVLVLAPGGTMAFYGPPQEGLRYFRAEDWADVFTRFRDSPSDDWAEQFRRSPEYKKYVAAPISAPSQQETPPERQRKQRPPARRRPRGTPAHVLTMARRYLRVMRSDRAFLGTALLMPIILGAVVRATPSHFGLVNSTPVGGLNVTAIQVVVILLLSSVLSGTALSIREFIKERNIYQGERLAGLSAAYLFSKVIVLGLLGLLQTALFVLVGLAGTQVRHTEW